MAVAHCGCEECGCKPELKDKPAIKESFCSCNYSDCMESRYGIHCANPANGCNAKERVPVNYGCDCMHCDPYDDDDDNGGLLPPGHSVEAAMAH